MSIASMPISSTWTVRSPRRPRGQPELLRHGGDPAGQLHVARRHPGQRGGLQRAAPPGPRARPSAGAPGRSGTAAARPATSAASGSDPVRTSVLNSPSTYRQPRPVTAVRGVGPGQLGMFHAAYRAIAVPRAVAWRRSYSSVTKARARGYPRLLAHGVNETPRITSANLAARTVRKLSPARRGGRGQRVGDRDQLVRVGALVAAAAHGRGDGPDRGRAVRVDPAGDVAQPVGGRRPRQAGRRVVAGRVAGTVYGVPRSRPA